MASGFLVLISFFTRIPIGSKIEYNEDNFKASLGVYSLMGVLIGIILLLAYLAVSIIHNNFVKGLFLTLSYTIVTGGIHLDGSADTADGLFSGRTGDRIFDIMSDPHIGSFGALCLIFIILSQFIMFSYLDVFACFLMPVVGRTSVILASWNKKYAKKTKGMGTIFIESISSQVLLSNVLILIIACMLVPGRFVLFISSAIALVSSLLISNIIAKKICGMTGDTCGFIIEIAQIIFMFFCLFFKGLII